MGLILPHDPYEKSADLVTVNIMAFYSATLFTQAHASERSALFFSWGFGLTNFAQVACYVARTFRWVCLHLIALPGQQSSQSTPSDAVLFSSSRFRTWPGLCWLLRSVSRYQLTTTRICRSSLCSYTCIRPSIRRVRGPSHSLIPQKHFLCSIAVRNMPSLV